MAEAQRPVRLEGLPQRVPLTDAVAQDRVDKSIRAAVRKFLRQIDTFVAGRRRRDAIHVKIW